ncbi:MAG: biopolymer transporter ExbD [Synergistaceae bacterium]|nr:biopolymer transporter ExbD [Synergistaceae bacterium]
MKRRRSDLDVDLTPLIDVLFMLILFFVLTAAFVQGRLDVDLPEGKGQPLGDTPVVITVLADGSLLWAGEETDREALLVLARKAQEEERPLLLAGDSRTPYGLVASLLDGLRREGIDEIGLALGGEAPRP